MKKQTVQLNVRIPKHVDSKIRKDVARFNFKLEDVATVILTEWFRAFSVVERGNQYIGINRKTVGRKAAA